MDAREEQFGGMWYKTKRRETNRAEKEPDSCRREPRDKLEHNFVIKKHDHTIEYGASHNKITV